MNAFVVAQHHGSFLTLESLKGKVEEIVVVVPQSQLEKYSGFDDPIFKEYGNNISRYCKKNEVETWSVSEPMRHDTIQNILLSIKKTGKWAILSAGAIYQGFDEKKLVGSTYGHVYGRPFDSDQRLSMYGMIGLSPKDSSVHSPNFFLNLDLNSKRIRELSPNTIARPDPLIGKAISSLECLRFRNRSSSSAVLHFWMESIKRNHVEQEYVSYPFDEYAKYAKLAKRYLPKAAYDAIVENGIQSSRYSDFANLEL